MFGNLSDTVTPDTCRLLKPARQLARLRPVSLVAVINELRGTLRQARALNLIHRFFPKELRYHRYKEGWYGTLADLMGYFEKAKWFEIDHSTLDHLHEWYMSVAWEDEEDDEFSEPFPVWWMSQYLEYIPVRFYNFGDEDWLNDVVENYPILGLIRYLVDPSYASYSHVANVLIEYQLFDALEGCRPDPDFFTVPADTYEPLRWLPDVVRYCARQTGNPLLDHGFDMIDGGEGDAFLFEWDEVEKVRELYREAKPVWTRIESFLRWCEGQEQFEEVAELLLTGEPDDGTDDDE